MSEFLWLLAGIATAILPFALGYWAGRIDGRRAWAMQQIRREQRMRNEPLARYSKQYEEITRC